MRLPDTGGRISQRARARTMVCWFFQLLGECFLERTLREIDRPRANSRIPVRAETDWAWFVYFVRAHPVITWVIVLEHPKVY